MRVASSTRYVALVVLCVVVGSAVGSTAPAVASLGAFAPVEAGDVVVADQEAGEVLRLHRDEPPTVVLEGLGAVRGVAVLSDGSLVAADSEAGSLVAVGGRFGDQPVEVATGLESPEGVATAGPGRVYVTSFSEGTLVAVDLDRGVVRSVAAGFDGPSAVVGLRSPRPDGQVAVAQWFGGDVAAIRRSGASARDLADGFGRPAGLATDGEGTLYVSDHRRDRVVAVDADGDRRRVAELDAPTGVALDPPTPARGQDYRLVVATAEGVVRVDPRSGAVETVAEVPSGVGVAVAPDELVAATPVADGEVATARPGGSGAADQAILAQADGDELDPVLVAIVAVVVFLAGVAVVSGVQLVRSRDDDEPEFDEGLSRKERRRARGTARAVRAAERKTAKEVARAEKRAEKLAPRGSGASRPVASDRVPAVDPATLFVGDPGVGDMSDRDARAATPTRKERREAARKAKVAARVAAEQARRDERAAKARAKDVDAQAREEAKAAATSDRAAGRRTRRRAAAPPEASAPVTDASREPAGPAIVEAVPPTPADRVPLFASPTPPAPATAGPFLESLFASDADPPPDSEQVRPSGAETDRPSPSDGGVPLFASVPVMPAPGSEPPPLDDSSPEGGDPPPARVPLGVPSPAVPMPAVPTPAVSGVPARTSDAAVDVADTVRPVAARVDLTEAVARDVPAPRGLRGRRRAKRRRRAAEHRHRQLRALNALLDVPLPALPPAPVRPALGMASAASVAAPDQPGVPPALRAAATAPVSPVAAPTVDPPVEASPSTGEMLAADDPLAGIPPRRSTVGPAADPAVAVPWPTDTGGSPGDGAPWPDEPPG